MSIYSAALILGAIALLAWVALCYVVSLIFSGFAFVAFVIFWSVEVSARKLWSLL